MLHDCMRMQYQPGLQDNSLTTDAEESTPGTGHNEADGGVSCDHREYLERSPD